MKYIIRIALVLLATTFVGTLAKADDKKITITKSKDTVAKVCYADGKGCAAMVPIKFDDGADWSTVKDTYTVSDSTAKSLMDDKETISIGSDGTATFHSKMWAKIKHKMGM